MVPYLVSAPAVALAMACALTMALEVGGDNPVWRTEPLNLTEAAALRDRGEVARLLAAGADPQAVRLVRGGFLYQDPARLTAVDAAVLADRPEILQLLLDSGVALDAGAWDRAWCAAASDTMRDVLGPAQPSGSSRACRLAAAHAVRAH